MATPTPPLDVNLQAPEPNADGGPKDYRTLLRPFYEAVAAQREDILVGRDRVDVFIDSGDCVNAALGMLAFLGADGFDLKNFEHPSVLADCLVARGWTGAFKLLGPHQFEFFSRLDLGFGLPTNLRLRKKAEEFLKFAKVEIESTEDGLRAHSTETHPGFLEAQARSAPALFKAVECVRGSWQTRLARWREAGLLVVDRGGVPYHDIFKSKLFERLREQYNKLRDRRPHNNDADAAALVALAMKVQNYNRDPNTFPLPRFFSNDRFLRRVIRRAGAAGQFKYVSPADNSRRSAICNVNYFVFRATFLPPSDRGGDPDSDQKEVNKVFAQITDIMRDVRPATIERIRLISVRGRPLIDIITEFEQFSFLSNVWSWELQHDYVQQAVGELDEAALQLSDFENQKRLADALQTVLADLEAGASEFKLARLLWDGIPARARGLRDRLKPADDPAKMIQSFGLVRFSFPEFTTHTIERWLRALLGDEGEVHAVRTYVVETLLSSQANDEQALVNRTVVASILWILGYDEEIANTPWSSGRSHHFSLEVLSAAAMRRGNYALPKAEQIRLGLEEGFARTRDPGMAIGAAYLLGEEWRRHPNAVSQIAPSTTATSNGDDAARESARKLIRRGIEYARTAYNELPDADLRRVYALNLYLFLLTEGGDPTELDEMRRLADMLRASRNRRPWQYRYDDTLARYHYRVFLAESSQASRSLALESTKREVDLAWDGCYEMDTSVRDFRALVTDALQKRQKRKTSAAKKGLPPTQ